MCNTYGPDIHLVYCFCEVGQIPHKCFQVVDPPPLEFETLDAPIGNDNLDIIRVNTYNHSELRVWTSNFDDETNKINMFKTKNKEIYPIVILLALDFFIADFGVP